MELFSLDTQIGTVSKKQQFYLAIPLKLVALPDTKYYYSF